MNSRSSVSADRAVDEPNRVPRCEHEHRDWATLARHVTDDFPELDLGDVMAELRVAHDAVRVLGLNEESLVVGEIIARHRLMIRTNRAPDIARLDPQPHPGRSAGAARLSLVQ